MADAAAAVVVVYLCVFLFSVLCYAHGYCTDTTMELIMFFTYTENKLPVFVSQNTKH